MKYFLIQTIILITYIISIFIALSILVSITTIQAKANTQTGNYRVVWSQDNLTYQDKIKIACEVYGCNSSQLLRVAKCESNFQNIPNSTGSGAFGIFQFMEPTFHYFSQKYLDLKTNSADWQNPDLQIVVASTAFANGKAYHWVCK